MRYLETLDIDWNWNWYCIDEIMFDIGFMLVEVRLIASCEYVL